MMAQDSQDKSNAPMGLEDCPEINPLYIFRWEEEEQSYLMLFPEGIIKLNDSAGHILTHCTGDKSLETIITDLENAFGMKDLSDDVYSFMEVAVGKGWIRIKS